MIDVGDIRLPALPPQPSIYGWSRTVARAMVCITVFIATFSRTTMTVVPRNCRGDNAKVPIAHSARRVCDRSAYGAAASKESVRNLRICRRSRLRP